jgi:hypothetical protein
MHHFLCFIFFQSVFGDKPGQEAAIHAMRHIVPCRNGKEGARVGVETNPIVEARRLCARGQLLAVPESGLPDPLV